MTSKPVTTKTKVALAVASVFLTLSALLAFFIVSGQSSTVIGGSTPYGIAVSNPDQPTVSASVPAIQEPAKYNFASVQGRKDLYVAAGGEVKAVLYFYNVDGNRTTHIALQTVQAPAGWEVEVVKNIDVERTQLSAEDIDVPQGTVSLPIPNRGYTAAKVATVTIRVPRTEAAGVVGAIRISGLATWGGQELAGATISQDRDFSYTVTVQSVNS